MSSSQRFRRPFRFFLLVSILTFLGLVYFYVDTYYLRSYRTVDNAGDPRWRVFDFHSRGAVDDEIYAVADLPAVKRVRETAPRRLLFEFHKPFDKVNWKVIDTKSGTTLSQGRNAEVSFPGSPYRSVYLFSPEGISLPKEVRLEIDFYPREKYAAKKLSWPDNYWLVESSVPFTPVEPRFAAEWAGLSDRDPEIARAREILRSKINENSSTLERAEQVFLFVMEAVKKSGGTPDDRLQAASPLQTYECLTGEGQGFCENRALVYYLFANAAGIKTRLIDVAGKFGPLKLTGHYFCESFIPEIGRWVYVDPQTGIARAVDGQDRPLSTLDLKRLNDLGTLSEIGLRVFDPESGSIISRRAEKPSEYLTGDLVIAYKFGYGKNKSFSKLKNFIRYPTLLYSTFPVPPYFRVRMVVTWIFLGSLLLAIATGIPSLVRKAERQR